MNYRGRNIDPIKLWEKYVEFPQNIKLDGKFLPKVVCPNPEHDTLKKHFQINVEDGLVHCFAQCGISGTFTRAISIVEGITEHEARRVILRSAGTVGKQDGRNSRSKNHNRQNGLHSDGKENSSVASVEYSHFIPQSGADYLESRGILPSAIAHWEIGWDKEDLRLVIPAHDHHGRLKFLIKRAIRQKDWPKYLYTEGFPKTSLLFGACHIDLGVVQSEGLVIVEGSIDTICFWQFGMRNVVGTLGTGLSEIQARIAAGLRPRRYLYFTDRDTAGIQALEIARRRLRTGRIDVARYPRTKFDPAELTREEAYRGIERAIPVSQVLSRMSR
jgi:DNA primase